MISFLFADGNEPFAIALIIMLAIATLEVVSMMFGLAFSSLIEGFLPEFDFDIDVDADADFDLPDGAAPGALIRILDWLSVGRTPVLVLFVAFLTTFSLTGLIVQQLVHGVTGHLLPALIASVPAFAVAIPGTRYLGRALGSLIPKEETEAVSGKSFIGRVAIITLGTAEQGTSAEGKVKDTHGQTHYVRVEPDIAGENFPQGTEVLLVKHTGSIYRGIRNPEDVLTD